MATQKKNRRDEDEEEAAMLCTTQCLPSQHLDCNFNKTRQDKRRHTQKKKTFFHFSPFSFLPVARGHGKDFFFFSRRTMTCLLLLSSIVATTATTTTTAPFFLLIVVFLTAKHCVNYLIKEVKGGNRKCLEAAAAAAAG